MSEVYNTLKMDKEPGFTLVELLITIFVLTILLAVGVPAFQSFIKNNRVTAQANDLISTIQLARSEALKRSANVVICASSDQASCTGKDIWTNGWIVFSDLNLNNSPDVGTGKCLEAEDCIITSRSGLSSGSTLTANADNVRFLPTGIADNSVTCPAENESDEDKPNTVCFTLQAKNCKRNQARKVIVTPLGHTLISTVPCS